MTASTALGMPHGERVTEVAHGAGGARANATDGPATTTPFDALVNAARRPVDGRPEEAIRDAPRGKATSEEEESTQSTPATIAERVADSIGARSTRPATSRGHRTDELDEPDAAGASTKAAHRARSETLPHSPAPDVAGTPPSLGAAPSDGEHVAGAVEVRSARAEGDTRRARADTGPVATAEPPGPRSARGDTPTPRTSPSDPSPTTSPTTAPSSPQVEARLTTPRGATASSGSRRVDALASPRRGASATSGGAPSAVGEAMTSNGPPRGAATERTGASERAGATAHGDGSPSSDPTLPASAARPEPAPASARSSAERGSEPLPGVASQLLSVLSPPRPTLIGGHTVTLALHPEDLGEVRVALTINGDQTTVRLIATTSAGESAIRASLGELQSQLGDGGAEAQVFVGLDDHGAQHRGGDDPDSEPALKPTVGATSTVNGGDVAVSAPSNHLVDVRI